MSSNFSQVFPPQLLDQLEDVADGSSLAQTNETLARLGFERLETVRLNEDKFQQVRTSVLHAWVHPAGMMLAAAGHADGNIYNVRAVAVMDNGWSDETKVLDRVRKVVSRLRDGTQVLNLTVAADQPGDRTLLTFLREMESSGLPLEGFDRWAQLAQEGHANTWLFCVGNERLEQVRDQHGLGTWLAQAPASLAAFVEHRSSQLAAAWAAPTPEPWEAGLGRFFQQEALASDLGIPSVDTRQRLSEWMDMGTGKAKWGIEWDMDESTGIMLPHVLAWMATETRAQARLVKWIRHAPDEAVEQAFLTSLPSGNHPVIDTIVAGAISGAAHEARRGSLPRGRAKQPPPKPALEAAAEALEALVDRMDGGVVLGVESVLEHVVGHKDLIQNPDLGAELVRQLTVFLTAVKKLEDQGRIVPSTPTSAVGLRALALRLEERLPQVQWGPLQAQLGEWAMAQSLPRASGEGRGRGPRL